MSETAHFLFRTCMYHSADLCTQIAVQLKAVQWRMRSVGASSALSKANVLRERFHSFITAKGNSGRGRGVRLGAKKRKIDGEVKRD